MATYDYSAYDPVVGQSDYPTKISNLITALGTDMTTESNAQDGIKTKTDWITVTQAVNLDTMESDIAINNAKVTNATHTGEVVGATALTIANDAVTYAKMQNVAANNVFLGNDNGAGSAVQELTVANAITLLNSGTALDADTLDTVQGSDYARISVDNSYTGRQNFLDYSENDLGVGVTSTINLDTSVATYFHTNTTLSGQTVTYAFLNPTTTGRVTSFTFEMLNAAGATSITWPTSVDWPNGAEPTWSSGVDLVSFITRDAGTTWLGIPGGFAFA